MFYAHVQQCEAKLNEASAALVTLAEEVTNLHSAGAQECEAAVAELLASTGQLQEAFEFVTMQLAQFSPASVIPALEAGRRL